MKPSVTPPEPSPAYFVTTRWSLVRASTRRADEKEKAREAVAQLCRIYWRPVISYLLKEGWSVSDAEDLTQEFFLKVSSEDFLHRADQQKGLFRNWLLLTLKDFLGVVRERANTLKRGAKYTFLSFEEWMEGNASSLSAPIPVLEHCTADRIFDLRWAATVSERALARLRQECVARGRERIYSELHPFLIKDTEDGDYQRVGPVLGLTVEAVKLLVFRLRRRFGALLREEVAETVSDGDEVEGELRYLFSILAQEQA